MRPGQDRKRSDAALGAHWTHLHASNQPLLVKVDQAFGAYISQTRDDLRPRKEALPIPRMATQDPFKQGRRNGLSVIGQLDDLMRNRQEIRSMRLRIKGPML